MKVTVYGGTNNKNYGAREIAACEKFGKFLGRIGAEVLTGACRGFPYYIGKTAAAGGCKVFGYTPAVNMKEHIEKYKFPTDGVTDLVYSKRKGMQMTEAFMQRSVEMTPFSDVVVAFGGSWGTFFELLLSFWYKKTIILIEEFGGAVEAFEQTYDFFGAREVNDVVHYGPKIFRVKTVDAAIKQIEKLIK